MERKVDVTKDGVRVEVGQVWRDLDRRAKRTVTVLEVHPEAKPHAYALVRSSHGPTSRIRISRMHRHGQGFALLSALTGPEGDGNA